MHDCLHIKQGVTFYGMARVEIIMLYMYLVMFLFVFTRHFKVTRHLCLKNSKKLQLLDVQSCNSANLLAKLKARMS